MVGNELQQLESILLSPSHFTSQSLLERIARGEGEPIDVSRSEYRISESLL